MSQNIVPRGDGSGSLGTTSKRWGSMYFISASFDTLVDMQQLQFDTSFASVPSWSAGNMFWDDDNKTVTIDMVDTDVRLQLGQEMYVYARNTTGTTINNGQVVKVIGAQGQKPTIGLAISEDHNNGPSEEDHILGVATAAINNNSNGYVTVFGTVNGIDTSTFLEGDIVYVSNTTSGSLSTKPPVPYDIIEVGIVLYSHATEGKLLVRPREPIHLHDITRVSSSIEPSHQQTLVYNKTLGGYWEPSYNVSGSFTGDFTGDGSGVTGVISSSWAETSSYAINSAISTYNFNAANEIITANDSTTVDGEPNLTFDGTLLNVTGNISASGDLNVGGRITAEEFHSEIVSSSIIYDSGSTKFGDSIDDLHLRTGSMDVSGSVTASAFSGDGAAVTGVISSSYAVTASHATNVPETASFAISSSYAITASYANNVPETASYALTASVATSLESTGQVGEITGSTFISGNFQTLDGFYISSSQVGIGPSVYSASIYTGATAGTTSLALVDNSSYDGCFVDYVLTSGSSGRRMGSMRILWLGTGSIAYDETSTVDIGTTSNVTLQASTTGSSVYLDALVNESGSWDLKYMIRAL